MATDKHSSKSIFRIRSHHIKPLCLEARYLRIGVDEVNVNGAKLKVYSRERTICDVLRYSNKTGLGATLRSFDT
ncbi:MAG: hypothetical protein AB1497_00965 [Bacillota bacterium]